MTPYPQYRAQRKLWGINALGSVVVEVESEDGTIGVGKESDLICNNHLILLFHEVFLLVGHLLVIL